ncbi:cardiac-enriched FHL2-interacting protein [Hyperolius riggenbachi]|uniref:cardiac-enriched FHL2-interacting protein n=1 Tax=Hyperolius riggenbachi TaxID=752182 RepID=UPI0035A317B8
MLRYKKHKRHADGVASSGVGVMDDTDQEVSNFTDRAFRSLCVAEEEPFNDVPHIPSPIRGMPLSTKYHLGIFNLSVRKTQPLAQLPTVPKQRGKWAPTFQPLLNSTKDGLIVAKPNTNKLFVPQPTGYKQRSKVSSLIKTFDNIENERPEGDELSSPNVIQRGKMTTEEEPFCDNVRQTDISNEPLESIKPDDMNLEDSRNLHRRTAREVFLESQVEICSRHSGSPCLLGSPIPDQTKKVEKQKDSLRRTAFLHSENSAFKSWTDIHKRHTAEDESDSSIPGTPPLLRSGTPCSPLLQRITPRTRAREAGSDVGWGSPASTISNTYDPIQMLRTVPPLPTKRMSKQSRELSHRTPRVHSANKNQAEDIQTEVPCQSPKEQLGMMAQSKSPAKLKQKVYTHPGTEEASKTLQPLPNQNGEIQEKVNSIQEAKKQEMTAKEDDIKISNKPMASSGRIKTLIKQIEKETIKDVVPVHVPEKKHHLKEQKEDNTELLPATSFSLCSNPNSPLSNNVHVPPWRRTNIHKIELEEKLLSKPVSMKESATEQLNGNLPSSKEDYLEDRPSISSFNIINLLTPVISRKSIQEALEEQPMTITPPPPTKTITLTDQDQEEIHLYRKRNEYKSKAPSLLFNLKDVRKRVKCTYNPATIPQNGYENNQTVDGKIQDTLSKDIPGNGINKLSEKDNLSNIDQTHVLVSIKQNENKPEFFGNASDNYLSLSSPPQVIVNKALANIDIHPEKDLQDEIVPKQYTPLSQFSPTETPLTKQVDYPVLNLYPKGGTGMNVEQKENAYVAWRKKTEPISLQDENVNQESEWGDISENAPTANMEKELENEERHTNQTENSIDIERQCSAESDEDGKEKEKNDSMKDEILYYAVSNGKTESKEDYEVLDTERVENVEDKKPHVCDNQGEDSTNAEEIKRPSSIIPSFKHNLFHIKDNKVRSSPVTKSVRPLLRSLSEDCLIYHKGEEYNFIKEKRDFRIATPNVWKNKDTKTNIYQSENMKVHNDEELWKFSATQPEKDGKYKEVNTRKEEADKEELWRKLSNTTHEWRKNEAETAESIELSRISCNQNSPPLNEPFFYPVEMCVSEVTGLSPECNALLGHNINESMVNGEHASSPAFDTADTNYSSLDNGHFEDAVSFSEDIACSTITSPMSESITCSMVASPMSVNTQSSGFATALSALDDISSPPLIYTNSKAEKCSFLVPDIYTPSNLETKTHEFIKHSQEKEPCLNIENIAQAAKPPAVPPKTEKALRRAKRLTKKRRKTDIPQRIQEGVLQESDLVLDVPSPANIIPTAIAPQSTLKPGPSMLRTLQQEELISESSTPSLPTTQRKLLQDPDSGQYFVVDIPVHFRIKTFYDPETGKYLQMSLPPSERSTPTLDMSNSPFTLYQRLGPVPVASIASLKQTTQLPNHNHLDIEEKEGSWHEGEDDCLKMRHSADCDSCDQSMAETPHSMDKTANRTRSPDIISMGDIEDFAMEAIS